MKFLRMKPGHGEIVLAEGDVEIPEQERELIEAFRRELDAGMWAAVPKEANGGRREAELVKTFAEVPRDARARDLLPARRRRRAGSRAVGRDAGRACNRGARARRARVRAEQGQADGDAGARRGFLRSVTLVDGAKAAAGYDYDPGRERRAEQRAGALLRSCVNDEEWAMYRDLGFLRVWGQAGGRYAYLIYPHKPLVAYVPRRARCSTSTASRFPTTRARTAARGCRTPMTCSPSGWR